MLYQRLLLPLVALTAISLSACNDTETPTPKTEPAPEAEATLNRSFHFAALSQTVMALHPASTVQTEARLTPSALTLSIGVRPTEDHIHFTLDRSTLTAAYAGTYSLRSTASTAGAQVRYTYSRQEGTGTRYTFYDAADHATQGELTISSYDSGRKLISGTYQVSMPGAADPFRPLGSLSTCNVTVSGRFQNVAVQE
ncbi:hypothetical protein [Hymenobacter koreensis]|uniref:Lipoprotein n=1 Tax=Hymenobacter koreensis TaxID=1084523 RepID=A0ABP8JGW0_9BACT